MENVINEASRLLDRRNSGESTKGGFFSESTYWCIWSFPQTHGPFIFLKMKIWIFGILKAVLGRQPGPFALTSL